MGIMRAVVVRLPIETRRLLLRGPAILLSLRLLSALLPIAHSLAKDLTRLLQ